MPECPVCNHTAISPVLQTVRRDAVHYRLYACASCGLHYWNPRSQPDGSLYEEQFEENSVLMKQRHETGLRILPVNHREFLRRHASGGGRRLLDVGCGDGILLEHAQRAAWRGTGIDFDSRSIATAKRRGLQDVAVSTIEGLIESRADVGDGFDAVTAFEVLEHQSDPADFLAKCFALTQPGGLFAGSVPNRRRLTFLTHDPGDLPPYHFTRWDAAALITALTCAGFTDPFITSVGYGYYLRNLTKPLKTAVRRRIVPGVPATELVAQKVEDLAARSDVPRARALALRGLKRTKGAIFGPVEYAEAVLERRLDKGQMLYFEATRPR